METIFPIGTLRGPYTCGKGNDPTGGVQYCVQTAKGWVYFIESKRDHEKCKREAEAFQKTVLKETEKDHQIECAVLAVINDGDGSLCGLNYTQKCALADYGLVDYCAAVKRFDPSLTRTQVRKAGEQIHAYYQNHVAEMKRYEQEKGNKRC